MTAVRQAQTHISSPLALFSLFSFNMGGLISLLQGFLYGFSRGFSSLTLLGHARILEQSAPVSLHPHVGAALVQRTDQLYGIRSHSSGETVQEKLGIILLELLRARELVFES
jgi:hypothetical protein